MASQQSQPSDENGTPLSSSRKDKDEPFSSKPTATRRHLPFLPTPIEAAALALYPTILTFGTLFSLLNPLVRNAPYDVSTQAHAQDPSLSPGYFARKSNLFNVLFVKRGWGWVTVAFLLFLFTHPATRSGKRRMAAVIRWGLATVWWILVTQWCFGPAIIDRGFRFTGGKCEMIEAKMEEGQGSGKDVLTAVACKASGGKWRGGHDISGHVFLLVLGSYFLLQEVGWVWLNHSRNAHLRDQRCIVMTDGAVKSAAVEGEGHLSEAAERSKWDALGLGGKAASLVVVLSLWMILMTAIYFHTWFEKLTGLLVALAGIYAVYFLPRSVPILRGFIGLPGI